MLRRALALVAVPDPILLAVQCSDWSAVQSGAWGLAIKVTLSKSLARQKGNYGMGLLP